jgi:hypothetical protein
MRRCPPGFYRGPHGVCRNAASLRRQYPLWWRQHYGQPPHPLHQLHRMLNPLTGG